MYDFESEYEVLEDTFQDHVSAGWVDLAEYEVEVEEVGGYWKENSLLESPLLVVAEAALCDVPRDGLECELCPSRGCPVRDEEYKDYRPLSLYDDDEWDEDDDSSSCPICEGSGGCDWCDS